MSQWGLQHVAAVVVLASLLVLTVVGVVVVSQYCLDLALLLLLLWLMGWYW